MVPVLIQPCGETFVPKFWAAGPTSAPPFTTMFLVP
jgi:hypothetical protein